MAISNGVNGHRVLADSAQRLLDRLEEPRTAEALNRLLDHAELLAYSATALDGLFRRAEELTDNVAASIAEVRDVVPPAALPDGDQLGRAFAQLPQLLDVAERLTAISKQPEFHTTLEALGKPETLNALTRLLGHMELLVFLADGADGLARRGEEITDNLRASLQEVSGTLKAPADLVTLLTTLQSFLPYVPRLIAVAPKFIEVIERLETVVSSPEFDALLNSGVFHTSTVALVGRAGDAFAESYAESRRSERKLGLIGILRALNDPDVQRAAALVINFGKRFGRTIQE